MSSTKGICNLIESPSFVLYDKAIGLQKFNLESMSFVQLVLAIEKLQSFMIKKKRTNDLESKY